MTFASYIRRERIVRMRLIFGAQRWIAVATGQEQK